jgi:DNA-binding winged helix-turn-helix (wHTH) protein/TolB-like protein
MAEILHFDRFEFHPDSGELIADGSRVRLEPQPAKVLAALALRAGEVVSREELQKQIWPADTFVDFERGINYCVGRIRSALGDTAASPRFIETLPKRGYRFLPAVARAGAPQAGRWPQSDPSVAAPAAHRVPRSTAGKVLTLARATLLIVGLGTFAWTQIFHPPTIAVALFDNETGRQELDRVAQLLTDAVVEHLARQTARWSVIGNAAILREPRPLRNLELIASSLHADFIVIGQIQPGRRGLTVLTHLIRARDQRHLWVSRLEPATEDVPQLAGNVAKSVAAAAAQHIGGKS